MILFLSVLALSVLVGYLTGGRLRRYEQRLLKWWGLAPLGLALQALPMPEGLHGTDLLVRVALFGASYLVLLIFAGANIRMAGMPLVFVGLALNALVIIPNGGMPVSRYALEASGQGDLLDELLEDPGAKHHLVTSEDILTPLGDVIPVPPPFRQVASVGDVLLYAGLGWLIVSVMRGRTAGLAPASEPGRYRGKHRPGSARAAPAPSPPAEATTWGT